MAKKPLIVGHRGASSSAAENTIMSYLLAFMQGADAIEADFRLTSDRHLVAVNDDDLKRMGNRAMKVEKTPLDKLRTVDVGRNGHPGSRGQRVPTIDEVMALVPKDKMLFIELKAGVEAVSILAQKLKAGPLKPQQVVLMSFEPEVLLALQVQLPKWPRMLLCQRRPAKTSGEWLPVSASIKAVAKSVGAEGVALDFRGMAVEPELVGELRSAGLDVLVWTVNRVPNARLCRSWGVKGIITNYPGRLARALHAGEGAKHALESCS
jgi:glycerophosphoryl diester phosphodiesterase